MVTGPGPKASLDQDRNLPALSGEGLVVKDSLPIQSPWALLPPQQGCQNHLLTHSLSLANFRATSLLLNT